MTGELLDQAAVAELLGIARRSLMEYRRRYADTPHPFPKPAGYVGRAPYWTNEQREEIRQWDEARRVGQGIGGGRPHKSK